MNEEMRLLDISGKKAVVVGGASGLGKAMATALACAGVEVCIADQNARGAQEAVEEIEGAGRKGWCHHVNITNSNEVREMVDVAVKKMGRIDVLVESAGLTITGTPMMDFTEEQWDKIIDVNLKGMFLVNQGVARQMMKQRSGRIINVGSMSSVIINQNAYGSSGVYCISKAGVVNLTKAFASDLAPYNVTVNAVSPGYMRTPLSAPFWKDPVGAEQKCSRIPLGRPGEPEELGGIVIYLASDASSYMTGANILVDGGYTIW
jgi:NAD(P)-dependent dehydrogenase (short-subunit alcohol dehydrogenase family)